LDDIRYHTKRWQQLRNTIIRRDGRTCATPGCTTDMNRPSILIVDHITEIRDGGDFWNPNNLQILCKPHNTAKGITANATRTTPTSPNA
jgi:5-methylcytosine-specific restriction endonuclease McrA